jgi:dUTP pyrophosphatase
MNILLKIENPKANPYWDKIAGTPGVSNLWDVGMMTTAPDSGLDLPCPETITIPAGETKIIDLGVKAEAFIYRMSHGISAPTKVPCAYYIFPRSSISKTPLRLANSVGIIDSGYRGNLMLALDNIKNVDYTIEAGQRLAQLCSHDLKPIRFSFTREKLSKTTRGAGGFGSTGK